MSLILDALRRAERERKREGGQRLTLGGDGMGGGRRGVGSFLWATGGAAVALAVVATVLVLRPAPEGPAAPALPPPTPSAEPVPSSAPPAPSPAVVFKPAKTPVADVPPPAAPGRALEPLPPPQRPAPVSAPAEEVASSPGGVAPAAPPAPPPREEQASPPEPSAPPASAGFPVPLRDLPSEVRERLGRLDVSAHVYADNPAERFVFVNGKVYRAGDKLGETGAVVEKITPEGAVLEIDGVRARLDAGR